VHSHWSRPPSFRPAWTLTNAIAARCSATPTGHAIVRPRTDWRPGRLKTAARMFASLRSAWTPLLRSARFQQIWINVAGRQTFRTARTATSLNAVLGMPRRSEHAPLVASHSMTTQTAVWGKWRTTYSAAQWTATSALWQAGSCRMRSLPLQFQRPRACARKTRWHPGPGTLLMPSAAKPVASLRAHAALEAAGCSPTVRRRACDGHRSTRRCARFRLDSDAWGPPHDRDNLA